MVSGLRARLAHGGAICHMAVGLGVFLGIRCADSLPPEAPGAGHSWPADTEGAEVGVERAGSKSLEMQKEQALELGRTRGRLGLCH